MESGGGAERARRLMMKALDDELAPPERAELEGLLAADADLSREWNRLARLKEVTASMTLRRAPDDIWRGYWTSVYRRLERGFGWVLFSLGAIILGSYGIYRGVEALLEDTALPLVVRAGALALGVGIVILVVSAIREKVFLGRRERYKDVEI